LATFHQCAGHLDQAREVSEDLASDADATLDSVVEVELWSPIREALCQTSEVEWITRDHERGGLLQGVLEGVGASVQRTAFRGVLELDLEFDPDRIRPVARIPILPSMQQPFGHRIRDLGRVWQC
jgi:hypothetical protein